MMETSTITLEYVRKYPKVRTLIEAANTQMGAIGYTEHGFRHAGIVAESTKSLLVNLKQDARTAEIGAISGFLHDIGNSISRNVHAETAGVMVFVLLNEMGMPTEEIVQVIAAIGNHEEDMGLPVSPVSAALIIADKSDVHHSRVQNRNPLTFDIHDRVNYSVQRSLLRVDEQQKSINLELTTDEQSASVMEYFEIFLSRMLICHRAADVFGYRFKLIINGVEM